MKILYIIESECGTEETVTSEIYGSLAVEGFNVMENRPDAFKDNKYYKITIEEVEGKKE